MALNCKNHHEVLYCPEESDWESYVKYHDVNYDWGDILAERRAKKKAGLCPDCKKNTPIYTHQFLKIPNLNASLYNNTHSLSNDLSSPKKLFYKMEETYWSNWKPNRRKSPRRSIQVKYRPQKEDREFHSDEDPGQQLIDYFAKTNFSSGSISGDDYYSITKSETTKTKSNRKSNTPFPLILEEKNKDAEKTSRVSIAHSVKENKTYSIPSEGNLSARSRQHSHLTIPPDSESGSTSKLKSFRHIDSYVITSKKKRENKEHFQQPKSIKLYKRKPVRGGSYPLDSSGKKDSGSKANFKLGAPGRSILVTGSSFGAGGNNRRGTRI